MAHILIIDDDQDFASAAACALRCSGHSVDIEPSTAGGLEYMLGRRPDLLILDVMFSEDSSAGFELARAMKHHHEELAEVPILMVTAVNTRFPLGFSRRDIDEEWLPVADFLEKPVDLGHLGRQVKALLEKGDVLSAEGVGPRTDLSNDPA